MAVGFPVSAFVTLDEQLDIMLQVWESQRIYLTYENECHSRGIVIDTTEKEGP